MPLQNRLLGETPAKAFCFFKGEGEEQEGEGERDNCGSLNNPVYPTTTNELAAGQMKSELPENQYCSTSTREKNHALNGNNTDSSRCCIM